MIGDGMALCTDCALALDKYIDENPAVVAALKKEADQGIAALEQMLRDRCA